MNLTHREIRGIILLLLLVTAVTVVTTCGGSAERVAVPAAADPAEADAFVLDSMRLVETVREAGQKKQTAHRDTAVHGDKRHGHNRTRKQRARNNAAPVPARKSPLDEPVAR